MAIEIKYVSKLIFTEIKLYNNSILCYEINQAFILEMIICAKNLTTLQMKPQYSRQKKNTLQ